MQGNELMTVPGIERQAWCSLCGATGRIEMHHVIRRSQGGHDGPQVPLCRECHSAHHDGRRTLAFDFDGERWYGGQVCGHLKELRIADGCDAA